MKCSIKIISPITVILVSLRSSCMQKIEGEKETETSWAC